MGNSIITDVVVKTKKANKQLDKFTKNVKNQAVKMKDSLFKIENVFAAGAAFLAVRQIGRALSGAIDAAIDAENAVTNLDIALNLIGDTSAETRARILATADAIEATTTTSADAFIEMTALAQSFVKTAEEAEFLSKAALDFAQGAGISFEEAVRRLGRGVQGATGDIGNFVPEIRLLTKEQLAAGEATKLLAERFEGAAVAAADTFAGASAQLSNSIGTIPEAFGNIIVKSPFLIEVMKLAGKAFRSLGKFIEDNSESIKLWIRNGLEFAISAMGETVEFITKFFIGAFVGLNQIVRGSISIWLDIQEAISGTTQEIKNQRAALAELEQEDIDLVGSVDASLDKIRNFVKAVKEIKVEADEEAETELAIKREVEIGITEEFLQTKLDMLRSFLSLEEEVILQSEINKANTATKRKAVQTKLESAANKKELKGLIELEKEKRGILTIAQRAQLSATSQFFGASASLSAAGGKKNFQFTKALQIAESTTSSYLAFTKNLALGPPAGSILAASALVSGLAAVSRIASQQPPSFQDGGIVSGASFRGDNINANVNSGEMILNREQQARLFNLATGGDRSVGTQQNITFNIEGQVGDSEETKEAIAEAVRDAQEFQNFNSDVA